MGREREGKRSRGEGRRVEGMRKEGRGKGMGKEEKEYRHGMTAVAVVNFRVTLMYLTMTRL